MQQTDTKSQWTITPSIFASGVFHAALLFLLVFGLPQWEMQAEQPEAIQVQLVQPEETAPEEEPMPAEEPEHSEQPEEEQSPAEEADELAELPKTISPVLDPVLQFGEEDSGRDASDLTDELDGSDVAEETTSEETQEEANVEAQIEEILQSLAPDLMPIPVENPGLQAALDETRSIVDNESDVSTRTAEDVSREQRAARLCATAVVRQLKGSPYPPSLLPILRLREGNVLQEPNGVFLSGNGSWYNLKVRCEFDDGVTRLVDFNMEVGDPIPPEEWVARGLTGS